MGEGLKRASKAAKATQAKKPPEFPISFETFRRIDGYQRERLKDTSPSCFNGQVFIRRYRVTIEEIDEPTEILRARLTKLWRECDNHHHWGPMQALAKSLGFELDHKEFRQDCPRRK